MNITKILPYVCHLCLNPLPTTVLSFIVKCWCTPFFCLYNGSNSISVLFSFICFLFCFSLSLILLLILFDFFFRSSCLLSLLSLLVYFHVCSFVCDRCHLSIFLCISPQPSAKSKTPLLKLARDVYQEQHDWAALRTILPALLKRQLIDEQQYQQLNNQACTALLQQAGTQDLAQLNASWASFSRQEKTQDALIAAYAEQLHLLEQHDEAIKLLSKPVKHDADDAVFNVIARIISADDSALLKLLQSIEVKCQNRIAYQRCMAQVYAQLREPQQQLAALQKLATQDPSASNYLALARVHEQLAQQQQAADAYRAAAQAL